MGSAVTGRAGEWFRFRLATRCETFGNDSKRLVVYPQLNRRLKAKPGPGHVNDRGAVVGGTEPGVVDRRPIGLGGDDAPGLAIDDVEIEAGEGQDRAGFERFSQLLGALSARVSAWRDHRAQTAGKA